MYDMAHEIGLFLFFVCRVIHVGLRKYTLCTYISTYDFYACFDGLTAAEIFILPTWADGVSFFFL
jgi:hypothetical protein